jgi:hypothetical protein
MADPEKISVNGEDSGVDMRRPLARHANQRFMELESEESFIDLGEHGEVNTQHVRFRDAAEPGHLIAYIRQEATDPKVIIPTVIALGVVAAGLYNLKYRKK